MTRHRFMADWPNLDWGKRDMELAKEIGCTNEAVRQWRVKLGKAKPERIVYTQVALDNKDELAASYIKDFAAKYGIKPSTLAAIAYDKGLTYKLKKRDWSKVDWKVKPSITYRAMKVAPQQYFMARLALEKRLGVKLHRFNTVSS